MFQPDKLADLISEDRCAGPKKADPHSLDTLVAFFETKNPAEQYAWYCPNGCAFGQYRDSVRKAGGFKEFMMLNMIFGDDAYRAIGKPEPHTFGAALERARAYCAAISKART